MLSQQELLTQGNRNRRGEVSISHLLDISFTPRERTTSQPIRRRRPRRVADPLADRATYINTTCRFVLDPSGDYRALLASPDVPVPMEHVQRIVTQPSACPICLEEVPEAPRMIECGHILCLPCMLRYQAADDVIPPGETKPRRYKECPLCFERIRPDRAKPVTFSPHNEMFDTPKEDEDVVLRLMFRPNGSPLALPKDTAGLTTSMFRGLPDASFNDISRYARLMKGSTEFFAAEYEREMVQLQVSRIENSEQFGAESVVWYDDAIAMIQAAIDGASPHSTPPHSHHHNGREVVHSHQDGVGALHSHHDGREETVQSHWDREEEIEELEEEIGELEERMNHVSVQSSTERSIVEDYTDSTAYFFYQAGFDTATKYVLSPLDVKVLKAAYGQFSALPPTLLLRVTNISYGSYVDTEMRKRMKYLSHLPVHTPVAFLECEWRGIVSSEVLTPFKQKLIARRRKKKNKDRKEERERRQYERKEKEQLKRDLNTHDTPIVHPNVVLQSEFDPELPRKEPSEPMPTPTPTPSVKREETDGWKQPRSQPSSSSASFAAIASGEATSGEAERELEKIMKSARKTKSGKKKLVLMSTSGGR
ncbi:hypothetical protein TRVA0_008S02564 [Trichomonascus vanleenenianus]|uniref:RING-type E3 ubiquitin transferase MAG2 n=1 Tax=Trichomonascus vanleenenianus TaxID=2268995 RepID=UPI003ECB0C98